MILNVLYVLKEKRILFMILFKKVKIIYYNKKLFLNLNKYFLDFKEIYKIFF